MAKFKATNVPDVGKKSDSGEVETSIEEEVENAVAEGQDKSHRQGVASEEEQLDRANRMATQGRRGCSTPKICLSCTPDNYNFIKILAKQSGRSMTRTINDIITMYRDDHQDYYEQIKKQGEENGFWEAEPWNKN